MENGIDDIMVSLAEKDGMQIIFNFEPLVPTALAVKLMVALRLVWHILLT
jgi:hypothetical protein